MKYQYTAYFYPDEEEQTCRVMIPALDMDLMIYPEPYSRSAILKEVIAELEQQLYIYEWEGLPIPEDKGEGDIGYEYRRKVWADTGKNNMKIRRIDISDDS